MCTCESKKLLLYFSSDNIQLIRGQQSWKWTLTFQSVPYIFRVHHMYNYTYYYYLGMCKHINYEYKYRCNYDIELISNFKLNMEVYSHCWSIKHSFLNFTFCATLVCVWWMLHNFIFIYKWGVRVRRRRLLLLSFFLINYSWYD